MDRVVGQMAMGLSHTWGDMPITGGYLPGGGRTTGGAGRKIVRECVSKRETRPTLVASPVQTEPTNGASGEEKPSETAGDELPHPLPRWRSLSTNKGSAAQWGCASPHSYGYALAVFLHPLRREPAHAGEAKPPTTYSQLLSTSIRLCRRASRMANDARGLAQHLIAGSETTLEGRLVR